MYYVLYTRNEIYEIFIDLKNVLLCVGALLRGVLLPLLISNISLKRRWKTNEYLLIKYMDHKMLHIYYQYLRHRDFTHLQ